MVNVWESLSLRIGYAKAVLVGVPGVDYKNVFSATFQPHGTSMQEQFETMGDVDGPSVIDVIGMLGTMIDTATQVATEPGGDE